MTSKTIKVIFPQNYIVDSKPQPSRMAIQNVHGEKSRKNANNTRVRPLWQYKYIIYTECFFVAPLSFFMIIIGRTAGVIICIFAPFRLLLPYIIVIVCYDAQVHC